MATRQNLVKLSAFAVLLGFASLALAAPADDTVIMTEPIIAPICEQIALGESLIFETGQPKFLLAGVSYLPAESFRFFQDNDADGIIESVQPDNIGYAYADPKGKLVLDPSHDIYKKLHSGPLEIFAYAYYETGYGRAAAKFSKTRTIIGPAFVGCVRVVNPPQRLPDLSVGASMRLTGPNPAAPLLELQIQNIGGADALPSQTRFCTNRTDCFGPVLTPGEGGQILPQISKISVQAAGIVAVTTDYNLVKYKNLTICADADREITETNESDNCRIISSSELLALSEGGTPVDDGGTPFAGGGTPFAGGGGAAAESITVTSVADTASGGSCTVGKSCTIRWISEGDISQSVFVAVVGATSDSVVQYLTSGNGTPNTGSISGTIGSGVWNIPAGQYRVAVYENDPNDTSPAADYSDVFSIAVAVPPVIAPTITVISPNGGERWDIGSSQTVKWTWNKITTNHNIKLVNAATGAVSDLVRGVSSSMGAIGFSVTVPQVSAGNFRVRVCDDYVGGASGVCDNSDSQFAIGTAVPPVLANTAPTVQVNPFGSLTAGARYTHSGAMVSDKESNPISYQWSLVSCPGTCPELSGASGSAGTSPSQSTISGPSFTPSAAGNYTLQLTVTENIAGGLSAQSSATGIVSERPVIKVTYPNGGEILKIDEKQTIAWAKSGAAGNSVDIKLKKGGVVVGTLTPLAGVSNSGNFVWNIIEPFVVSGDDYKIIVGDRSDASVFDESDAAFTIGEPATNIDMTQITLSSINLTINNILGGAYYVATINNKSSRPAADLNIAVRIDQTGASRVAGALAPIQCGGGAPGVAPSGTCISASALQAIVATDNDLVFGYGKFVSGPARAVFELRQGQTALKTIILNVNLLPKPTITVKIPNGGETWEMGGQLNEVTQIRTPYPISWHSVGMVNPVTIYLKQSDEPLQLPCDACDFNGDGVSSATERALTAEFKKYDVNGDRRIDQNDLDEVHNALFGGSCDAARSCDVNGYDGVSIGDEQAILSFMIRLYDLNNDRKIDDADKDIVIDLFAEDVETGCADGKLCNFNFMHTEEAMRGIDGGDTISAVLLYDGYHYILSYPEYDLDNDGRATQKDKILLEEVASGVKLCPKYSTNAKSCDLNKDEIVAGSDVAVLNNYLISINATQAHEGVIAANIPTKPDVGGTYKWNVLGLFVAPADNYKIMIYDGTDMQVVDESNSAFTIESPAPTIITPTENQLFTIDQNLKITLNASHPMFLTRYRVRLYQKDSGLIYESSSENETIPFVIDANLVRKSDGKRVLDLLREGPMIIMVEGLMPRAGYTKPAVRSVKLQFDRRPPTITGPKENEDISLGEKSISIRATHPSKPMSFRVTLSQNGIVIYQNDTAQATPSGLVLTIDRTTTFGGTNVFGRLDKGKILLSVEGNLLQGRTQEAQRMFNIITVPVSYDLNDDQLLDYRDLAIIQVAAVYDSQYRKAVDEQNVLPKLPPIASVCFAIPLTKNCNFNNDFDTKARAIIDSRDAAILTRQPGYQASPPAFGRLAGTLNILAPLADSTSNSGNPPDVTIVSVTGATGYLIGFARRDALYSDSILFENYKDTRSLETSVNAEGQRLYRVPSAYRSRFTAGPLDLYVRALVNNQWTDAAVVRINLK